jgi:hypothetical protein
VTQLPLPKSNHLIPKVISISSVVDEPVQAAYALDWEISSPPPCKKPCQAIEIPLARKAPSSQAVWGQTAPVLVLASNGRSKHCECVQRPILRDTFPISPEEHDSLRFPLVVQIADRLPHIVALATCAGDWATAEREMEMEQYW